LQNRYALAEHLHKTLAEIEAMTVEEYKGWMAYMNIQAEKHKNGKN
jgi:hypothetical protein